MEWTFEIIRFLPLAWQNELVNNYIKYHSDELDKCIENEIEMWIYIHTHILYMVFIYFQLLRISQLKKEEFKHSLMFVQDKDKRLNDTILDPFSFSGVNEKTVFRFFRLIGFDDGTIGNISHCVNGRNDILHASWNHISELDKKVGMYVRNMERIVCKSEDFFREIFEKFRDENPDLFEEWYDVWWEDLESNLYIQYHISDYERSKIVEWIKTWKVIEAIKKEIE